MGSLKYWSKIDSDIKWNIYEWTPDGANYLIIRCILATIPIFWHQKANHSETLHRTTACSSRDRAGRRNDMDKARPGVSCLFLGRGRGAVVPFKFQFKIIAIILMCLFKISPSLSTDQKQEEWPTADICQSRIQLALHSLNNNNQIITGCSIYSCRIKNNY